MVQNSNMKLLPVIVLIIFLSSCSSNDSKKQEKRISEKQVKKEFVDVNKTMLESEKEDINDYIALHGWDMQTTSTGLRYSIYHEGHGKKAKPGMRATINYELRLINDYLCYSSEEDGSKTFIIGKGEVVSGLDEAMLFLSQGDKARIIVPSYLGYGLLGDQKEIPKRATLIYDIELTHLK
jgi:FKBP-type peptidyl-prolyl cis-trans isomerase